LADSYPDMLSILLNRELSIHRRETTQQTSWSQWISF
jgi:hypothetical protein